MSDTGVLAIWNDCRAGREADVEAWFQGEHLLERLAVPGFLYGRRHLSISGSSGYFNYYLTQTPDVLTSKPYLERLDNPTPMTRRIMSEAFYNMNRTICRRVVRTGRFRGTFAVTVRFNAAPDLPALKAALGSRLGDPNVAGGEIWIAVDQSAAPVSAEEKMRGGDRKIHGCLMVETLHQPAAEALGRSLSGQFAGTDVGVFRVLCEIGRDDG